MSASSRHFPIAKVAQRKSMRFRKKTRLESKLPYAIEARRYRRRRRRRSRMQNIPPEYFAGN